MPRVAVLLPLGLLVLAACGGAEASTNGSPDGASPNASSSSGSTGSSGSNKTPDANGCCAPDETQSGCMNLGGAAVEGSCSRACDFWCSTNWRLEKDEKGCDEWRYDMRAPGPDETSLCMPKPDAGIADAASDG